MNEEVSRQLRDTMAEILSWDTKDELVINQLDLELQFALQDLNHAIHPTKKA